MFKKGLVAVFFSLLLALTMGTTGFAAEPQMSPEVEKALESIEKTNEKILKEIEKGEEKAAKLYADYLDDAAKGKDEAKKAKAWQKYDKKVNKLIADLSEKAQDMTEKEIDKAARSGVVTEIYLVPGYFGDRHALIDPIRVIGW